jgi:arylsulfatase A-like enzyme
VISHGLIGTGTNFDQGFEVFDERHAKGYRYGSTHGVTARAISLLDRFAAEARPFFLFVHYFDPHYNYNRHAQYGFAPQSAGRLDGTESIKTLRALTDPTAAEVDLVKGLYDEEVRYTDQGFGTLLATLEELDLKNDTLIIFTADHGEEFYERGWLGHTRTLYDEIIRVPLLVRMPKGRNGGTVVRDHVSLVGLTPTVLDIMGVDATGKEYDGPSFAPLVLGRGDYASPPIFAEVDFADRPREPEPGEPPSKKVRKRALIQGEYKLVQDLFTGETELYHLGDDPLERVDLARERPEVVEAMAPQLEAISEQARADSLRLDERIISEEELEVLESLGYVGQ